MIVTKIIPNIEIIIVMITKTKMLDTIIVAKNLIITIVTKTMTESSVIKEIKLRMRVVTGVLIRMLTIAVKRF